jgi:hypothetical protein
MQIPKLPAHYFVYGTVRNILAGAGLCYSIENKRYLDIPFTLFFPSVYAGYHVYKNKESVIEWAKQQSYTDAKK